MAVTHESVKIGSGEAADHTWEYLNRPDTPAPGAHPGSSVAHWREGRIADKGDRLASLGLAEIEREVRYAQGSLMVASRASPP